MQFKIESILEDNTMDDDNKKHKHHHKLKATTEGDKNRLFHQSELKKDGVTQTTTVTVTVNPASSDGDCTTCLKSFFSCFKH